MFCFSEQQTENKNKRKDKKIFGLCLRAKHSEKHACNS